MLTSYRNIYTRARALYSLQVKVGDNYTIKSK